MTSSPLITLSVVRHGNTEKVGDFINLSGLLAEMAAAPERTPRSTFVFGGCFRDCRHHS
jgi:hypothetical protein